jgi:putative transposase
MFNFELSIMKRIKFSESQIIKILNEYESGREVKDLCREYGISRATFYNWKKKFSGMDASQLKRLKELEEENRQLKRMYADLSLDHHMLKDVLGKKF